MVIIYFLASQSYGQHAAYYSVLLILPMPKLGTSWPQLQHVLSTLGIEILQVVNGNVEIDKRTFPVSTAVQLLGLGEMKC